MTRRSPAPHAFVPDPTVPADAKRRRYCRCGLHEHHDRHTLPPMTAEQHAAEDRRLGERETP